MDDNHPAEDVVDHPEEEEMGGEKEESMMVVEAGEGSGSALVEHDERGEDMLGNSEAGPSHEGKRVKVYELRDASWFDRGTGYCKGVYDDSLDLAMLIVEAEDVPDNKAAEEENDGPGGFLKEDLLLSSRVEKDDIYSRQQDTLIVWTEPRTGLDIALSFQDAEGCEDIWQFITEVQRHLANLPVDVDPNQVPSSSSPLTGSPMLGVGSSQMGLTEARSTWEAPTLANIKQQEMWLRMQAKSPAGRERAVEHIIGEDYIKQLITVFDQAEDLESLEDLHALCSLMQTILMFNDNTILEYILQDSIFMGVIGIFEYDPDFPNLKASYRQFFQDIAKFRQVVEIKDPHIRNKIHQLFRVQYLKDVVLGRLLDDGTFGTLNGFMFFTQVDIITHIQGNEALLNELLSDFREVAADTPADQPLDERKRDIVLFLNQLMVLGKGIQLPSRLVLYRGLVDRGLLFVCEWAFQRHEAQLLHAGAEILTLAVEHDVNVVRMHILREDELQRPTLVQTIINLLTTTKNMGLLSQMGDSLRTLLDTPAEDNAIFMRKEAPITENFVVYFYESCVGLTYKPLLDLPEIKPGANVPKIPREQASLLHLLIELLSSAVVNQTQSHRASYFILSNPICRQILSLLYVKDKPLRHAALRFMRSCLRVPNHFIHRYFVKNDLMAPLLDLLDQESTRDNMISSSCMEVLDIIRKENIKPIINNLYDNYKSRLESLSTRPFLKSIIFGLTTRWEQNNEPPPAPPQPEAESSKAWSRAAEAQEEDYFNASDEEEIGPVPPKAAPQKRKRVPTHGGGPSPQPPKRPSAPSPGKTAAGGAGAGTSGAALGLDYDDGSDSEGSVGAQSPSITPASSTGAAGEILTPPELEEDLGDVAMKMRAKRMREEAEDEEFVGLLMRQIPKKEQGTKRTTRGAAAAGAGGGKGGEAGDGGSAGGQARIKEEPKGSTGKEKESGKKIRLSLGSFGKRLGTK